LFLHERGLQDLADSLTLDWALNKLGDGAANRIAPKLEQIMEGLGIRPALASLEVHVADHCNLNCKGCDHLSPIADKWFADPEAYDQDLRKLQELFTGIRKLCLLGGEPLLHPKLAQFLFYSRSRFPKSRIQIMTNGLLLESMPESFWDACKKTSIEIVFNVYPPLYQKEKFLVNLAKTKGVSMITRRVTSFQAFMNIKGDSDPNLSFRSCEFRHIHQLQEGKLFTCVAPMVAHYFNRRYGTHIPSGGWVNIYSPNLTGWAAKKILCKSFITCSYCAPAAEQLINASFPWSTSKLDMSEWMGSFNK
jgi:organic radical activating enzyme